MNNTTYYELPIYEPNDVASLIDGYNKAILAVDSELHKLQNDIDLLKTRVKTLEMKGA